MTVLDLLTELEDVIKTASTVPLTGKIMVDASEVQEIIDEGLVSDTGAFVCEAMGKKDGKEVIQGNPAWLPCCCELSLPCRFS